MSHPRIGRRAVSVTLALGLVGAAALTLTGCTPDPRIAVIEEAVKSTAEKAAPYLIGVKTGDVAKALSDAGKDTTIMVPISVPDLTTAQKAVVAEVNSDTFYRSVGEASAALAASGQTAWQQWFQNNQDQVGYVTTTIPANISGKDDDVSVTLDRSALVSFAEPIEVENIKLFLQAVEQLPQWQQAVVAEHCADFAGEVTGLDGAALNAVRLAQSAAPVKSLGNDSFEVLLEYPDPQALVTDAADAALKAYGKKKIFGAVSKSTFQAEEKSHESSAAASASKTSTSATVTLNATGEVSATITKSLENNLAAESSRYTVSVQPGSYITPADIGTIRSAAADKALKQLAKQVVKKQSRPATKLLSGGRSGQLVTIKTGSYWDHHIVFFKWDTKKQAVSAFIRKGKSLSFRLPVGSYRLVYATGTTWYGPKYSYGPNGDYEEFKKSYSSPSAMKITIRSNYHYAITIEGTGSGGNATGGTTTNPFST